MTGQRQPPGPLDPTLPLDEAEAPAVEGWDDSTRLDPPGTVPGADPTGQEIAAALGRALQSHLPQRDLGEDDTVLPPGGLPSPPPRPAPAQSASLARPEPPRAPAAPGRAAPPPEPVAPAGPLTWTDDAETASASPRSPLDGGASTGPFGVDSTELDLDLWRVPTGAQPVAPGGAAGALVEGSLADATVRLEEPPAALRGAPDAEPAEPAERPPWETDPKPWAVASSAEPRPAIAVRIPPPLGVPAPLSSAPAPGTPRGAIERASGTDPASRAGPASPSPRESMSAAPRVVLGRPVLDPAAPLVPESFAPARPRRAYSRVMPAGPSTDLDVPPAGDGELPPLIAAPPRAPSAFARFGPIAVLRARRWLPERGANLHNPSGRPGGVGVPIGAERRSYRVATRLLAVLAILVVGTLLGILLTFLLTRP